MQRVQMRMKLSLKIDICYAQHFAEAHSEPCQASQMKLFTKTVNGLTPLKTAIAKMSTFGVWYGSEHAFSFFKLYI